jgi:hypothetical protein
MYKHCLSLLSVIKDIHNFFFHFGEIRWALYGIRTGRSLVKIQRRADRTPRHSRHYIHALFSKTACLFRIWMYPPGYCADLRMYCLHLLTCPDSLMHLCYFVRKASLLFVAFSCVAMRHYSRVECEGLKFCTHALINVVCLVDRSVRK